MESFTIRPRTAVLIFLIWIFLHPSYSLIVKLATGSWSLNSSSLCDGVAIMLNWSCPSCLGCLVVRADARTPFKWFTASYIFIYLAIFILATRSTVYLCRLGLLFGVLGGCPPPFPSFPPFPPFRLSLFSSPALSSLLSFSLSRSRSFPSLLLLSLLSLPLSWALAPSSPALLLSGAPASSLPLAYVVTDLA